MVVFQRHGVIGEMVRVHRLTHMAKKEAPLHARTALFLQLVEADAPFAAVAAVLAGQLIQAPVERLAQAEIIPADGQDLCGLDSPEEPITESDLQIAQSICMDAPFPVILVGAYESEAFDGFFIPGFDRGLDHRSRKALKLRFQTLVAVVIGLPVRLYQEIVRR